MRILYFFFFNDTATTEIYTLSLHDALPISSSTAAMKISGVPRETAAAAGSDITRRSSPTANPKPGTSGPPSSDRKSTRLNSSHLVISYAVFCLKKKKKHHTSSTQTARLSSA